MPKVKATIKKETTVVKIPCRKIMGRSKTTEPTVRGSTEDMQDASLVPLPSVGQSGRAKLSVSVPSLQHQKRVAVVSKDGSPLMPTTASRAKRWIKSGKALKRWKKGIFYVKLTVESGLEKQDIIVGVDPGSKKEGFCVKSEAHTLLNLQADSITHVKDSVKAKRNMRRSRRGRTTPCRKNKYNRKQGGLTPSTKARWQWKLNIIDVLKKIYPITDIIVEDIKAKTIKGAKKWNTSFSPLQSGKKWFYSEVEKRGKLWAREGFETYTERNKLGLKKLGKKTSSNFYAHCVDAWVLGNMIIGGHVKPENEQVLCICQPRLHRRQLHRFQADSQGTRKSYGGTMSQGYKRGGLVLHQKFGITYVGGSSKGRLSLHNTNTGERLTKAANLEDIETLTRTTWITSYSCE